MSAQITPHLHHYNDGIYALDSGYFRDEFDAIHLIIEKGRVAVIDTSTRYAVPRILAALQSLKLGPQHVDWIVLSHVHLDHAGGAGELMRLCPNARLTVHPRGARHMIDPSKLWAAVCEVYGVEMATREYGGLDPIDASRIVETTEGSTIDLNGRIIEFWDSPGHAKHHVYIRDTRTGSFFTGDTFGISYRELDNANGAYIFVTSSPSQFNPDELKQSMRRLMAAKPPAVYLTHYAQVTDVQRHGEFLLRQTDQLSEIALRHNDSGQTRWERIHAEMQALMLQQLREHGTRFTDAECTQILALDLKLNTDGLICWLDSL